MRDNASPLILLTRPSAQASRFAEECRAEIGTAAEILISPMQEIVLRNLPDIPPDAGLIFTSENGVRAYQAGNGPKGKTAFCVGARTALAARQAGLATFSAGGAADDLVALIRDHSPTGPLVHLHGVHVRGHIADRLGADGFAVSGHVVYDQQPLPLSTAAQNALTGPRPVIVPLFSPRSATLFAAALPRGAEPISICISDATKTALPADLQARAGVARSPTSAAMLKALARQLSL